MVGPTTSPAMVVAVMFELLIEKSSVPGVIAKLVGAAPKPVPAVVDRFVTTVF